MEKKTLVIHMPVLHRGYFELLDKIRDRVARVLILDVDSVSELSEFKPDIASIGADKAIKILNSLGYANVSTISLDGISAIARESLILIQDEVSRNMKNKYLNNSDIEWHSVFLRWDKKSVLSGAIPEEMHVSEDSKDIGYMKEAYMFAENTGDWWRQIGAVLVKNNEILLSAWNRDLPGDHTPYQVGEVRDLFKAGERPELANTIHAEQNIIAQAAKKGISLEGSSLYVTHFPCPVCAKLIACSGVKYLFFAEGSSVFDGQKVLEAAGIKITCVRQQKEL